MKKSVLGGISLLVISLAVFFYSFYYWPPPTLTVNINQNGATDNIATYTLTDLPSISGTGAHFRVMLSHGDGTYFLGTLAELAAHTHTYSHNSSGYQAFADVVAAYDDKKKPPKRTNLLNVQTASNNTSVLQNNTQIMNGKKILLRKNTNAVPGDSITYMITYEHSLECDPNQTNGTVEFEYDNSNFELADTDRNFNELLKKRPCITLFKLLKIN